MNNRSENSQTALDFEDMHFVHQPAGKPQEWSMWQVPATTDYAEAYRLGAGYARQYLQLVRDNPDMVGMSMLWWIVRDMNTKQDGAAKGYMVGFFSMLEKVLAEGLPLLDGGAVRQEVVVVDGRVGRLM